MEEVNRIGNIYGFNGGNYAGNVYGVNGIAPTIRTYQGGGSTTYDNCCHERTRSSESIG